MATFCPYCNEEIETAIYNRWVGDYWTHSDSFECPICKKELEIEVVSEPVFIARKAFSPRDKSFQQLFVPGPGYRKE